MVLNKEMAAMLNQPATQLYLTVGTEEVLERTRITSVGELVGLTSADLRRLGFRWFCIREIRKVLEEEGLCLR